MSTVNEEDIIICRCEDISLADIRRLIKRGYATIDEIKRLSRAGMGPCQGKTCRLLLMQELARSTGRPMAEIALGTFRPPTKPFKLGLLVGKAGIAYREKQGMDPNTKSEGGPDQGGDTR